MQILEIVLYNRHGDIRHLSLEPGKLNVITGVSGTDKSAVLEIVHFCLGDDEDFRVPTGVISDLVAWYAIRVRIGSTELFIARTSPRLDDYANNAVALAIGDGTPAPALDDLEPTTNVESLNGLLTRLVGIEENVQTPYRSARPELEANVRHALLYCFQRQYEIANPEFLFHRQTHGFIKLAIQDTLPFFVGAAARNQVEQQRRLRTLRRELRIARQRRDELLRTRTQALGRGARIISEARNVGLADSEQAPETLDTVIDLLRAALDAPPAFPELSPSAGRELARVEQRRLELTNEFRRVREEIDFVRLLTREQDGYGGVVSEQFSRRLGFVREATRWWEDRRAETAGCGARGHAVGRASTQATNRGAFMEQSGRDPRQPLANGIGRKAAQLLAIGCQRLPPVATDAAW